MSVKKGASWSRPAGGPADLVVAGDDAALARALPTRARTGDPVRVAWQPSPHADFARAVGLVGDTAAGAGGLELPCDLLRVVAHSRLAEPSEPAELLAVNMVVVGPGPDRQRRWTRTRGMRVDVDGRTVHDGRTCAVVVANGQHLRGGDLVPRGHPGDGRIEAQAYSVARNDRAEMRARLNQGTHLPHPGIRQSTGAMVEVAISGHPAPLEVDGVAVGAATDVVVTVVPGALLLLL